MPIDDKDIDFDALQGERIPEAGVSDRIFTIANVVSLIRLFLIPVYFALLLLGYSVPAAIIFGIAAVTDFLDGQIARRTNTVTKLGKILDPAVDRLLVIMGVLGVYIVGRLPLWVIIVILGRDLFMLLGGGYILTRYHVRVDVVFAGKFVTTLVFVGFFGLMMNWPLVPGLGIVDLQWLPGFCEGAVSWGIWAVYLGMFIGIFTTLYYVVTGTRRALAARASMRQAGSHEQQ